jgi:amino acid transporter
LIYSPIKQLIEGTPKQIWPKKLIKLDDNGMPVNAMWVQCFIVVIIIAITSFGGDTSSAFLNYLILMSNVAMTIPYIFIALAFIPFKKRDDIDRPFVIYKSKGAVLVATAVVVITITFANVFTIIQPILENRDYVSTIFQIAGPIVFTGIALVLFGRYERNYLKK